MKRIAFASIVLLLAFGETTAAQNRAQDGATIFLETDPATFAFAGHSAHVRRSLRTVPGLVVGAGLYGMRLPSLMTNLHAANRDEGWTARIDNGYGLFADYHPSGEPGGLFVGLQLALQNYSLAREGTGEKRSFHAGLAMARIGTLYKPFDSSFYVLPWAGVGVSAPLSDASRTLLDETYELPPVTAFATLHVGWEL